MFQRRTAAGWLIAYLVVAGLNVLGGFLDADELLVFSKPFLMPLLLAFFMASLAGLRHPLATWVTWALLFSWVGDLLLMGDGDLFFILGIAAFLCAQICYIMGFRPFTALGPLSNKPWLALPYVAVGAGLLVALAPDLETLFVPVVIYAVALVTMAILAIGVSPATAAGAALFLLSESLIALTELSSRMPDAAAAWIMPAYVVGQLLIVLGVLQNLGRLGGVRQAGRR